MSLQSTIGKVVSPLWRRNVRVGLAVVLFGPLVLSGVALQGDESAKPPKATEEASSLAAAEMIFRGAEAAAVGQRFTLEVLILNSGNSPLKDLEFHAKLDDHLEQAAKGREHRAAVEAIAPDDLHIVRLTLTPRKSGPGGLDITLRGKNGAMQQVRYVMPITAEDAAPPAEQATGASPLQFKIAPLKECVADRAGIVLINVRNADRKPMPNKLDLIVSYGTMGRDNQLDGNTRLFESTEKDVPSRKGFGVRAPVAPSNPTRKTHVSLPALESGESFTVPVRITPRRIGELGIAITAKDAQASTLATARLPVRFDPNAPVERLLPVRAGAAVPVHLPRTLAEVPEVSLEDPHAKALAADEAFEHVSHLIEKINHANATKTDAYMEALVRHRPDVRGLPFTLGDACRLPAERGQQFQGELSRLRVAMTAPATLASQLPNPAAQQEPDAVIKARIAALVQVVEPEGPQLGKQMVKYLSALSHEDATRALAKLAISADDEQVRTEALAALATRRDNAVNDVFTNGLDYPWPAVAERTTEAIVKLKLADLAPQLVEMLDRPDPRAPQLVEKDGKTAPVVREVVRINHLRNCLLCHSPAHTVATASAAVSGPRAGSDAPKSIRSGRIALSPTGALTAPVPLPNQALPTPTPHGGYGHFTIPDTLVSFDVTYLRQDFSVKLSVANANPWPEQQRFDFLVRTRELSEQDAQAYRDLLRPTAEGELSPYRRAAVTALRQLTGRDAAPTAVAWRQLLAQIKAEAK